MNNKAFNKGDEVTVIGDWDGKGTVYHRKAIVYSCGKVRMILTDVSTGQKFKEEYAPKVGDFADIGRHYSWRGVYPRMSEVEAEAKCLEAGALIVAKEKARMEDRIESNEGNAGFIKAMQNGIAALHEPRFYAYN